MSYSQQVVYVGGTLSAHATGWLLLFMLLGLGCGPGAPASFGMSGSTMGTQYSVKVEGVPPATKPTVLATRVEDELQRVNAQMSTYDPESELSRFNEAADSTDWFGVSAETAAVVLEALEVAERSGGAFDPTVMPLVELWGFGPAEWGERPPSERAIADAMTRVGYRKVEARTEPPGLRRSVAGVTIDLSAIAKGHGVDRVCAVLEESGFESYFVEIGGEIRTRGRAKDREWTVGIERPRSDSGREIHRTLALRGRAIATSGNYRNFFESAGKVYGHSIDARTGWPVSHSLLSASVIADTCQEADAWATAFLVLGLESAEIVAERHQIAALFLIRDGESGVGERQTGAWSMAPEN